MLFIFDWDGTLSDSAGKIVTCMQRAGDDEGVSVLEDDTIKNIIGLGLPEAVNTLYPGENQTKQEQIAKAYSRHWLSSNEPTPLFNGVENLIESLRAQGYFLAVATGKSRRGLDRVLSKLDMDRVFHATRCADETLSKPNPLMLNQILEELDINAADAVMVGDTEYDMAMAECINMQRVAVSYCVHHIDRLKKYTPVMCIDSISELENFNFNS